jgi:hypothetical protein
MRKWRDLARSVQCQGSRYPVQVNSCSGGVDANLRFRGIMQAFTVLDHAGFKQFVRLRVRADGSGIDGWCIGAANPLRDGEKPVLVDHFSWRPFRTH